MAVKVVVLGVLLLCGPVLAIDKEGKWEIGLKLGSLSYLNDLPSDPGSGFVTGLMFGRSLGNLFVGCSISTAYFAGDFGPAFGSKSSGSTLVYVQRRWPSEGSPFGFYADVGLGRTDPVVDYDEGGKPAGTIAIGLRIEKRLVFFLENRQMLWRQSGIPNWWRSTDKTITATANKIILGMGFVI